jgi:membrane protein
MSPAADKPKFSWSLANLKRIFVQAYKDWNADDAQRMGAALAYYTILSLAPLLILVITVAGFVLGRQAVEGQLMYQISDLVGPEGAKAIQAMIAGASNQKSTGIMASVLGLLALLWGATSVISELRSDLNRIWDVPSKDGGVVEIIKERSYLVILIFGAGFLLLVSLTISAALAAIGKWLGGLLPVPEFILEAGNFLISFIVITLIFAAIFKFLPDRYIQWSDVFLGAAFTSLLFSIGKLLIGLYLGKAGFGSTFGAAGSLVIVLVWVYYSAQIFFFGAEVTKVYAEAHGSITRPPHPSRPQTYRTNPDSMARSAASGNAALPPITSPPEPHESSRSSLGDKVGAMLGSAMALGLVLKRVWFSRKDAPAGSKAANR